MRKSKEETARTRERIIGAAAAAFRQSGIEGTGLSELMAAAGLTHGGFYRHFQSKDDLVAAALASAVASEMQWIAGSPAEKQSTLAQLAASYLSSGHKEDRAGGCPFAALGSELARSDEKTRQVATEGLLEIINVIASRSGDLPGPAAQRRALVAFSTMVGAMTLARMVTDPMLASNLLSDAAKAVAGRLS